MITVQETTVWPGNTPNHKYILTDDQQYMLGYVRAGYVYPHIFKTPIRFDVNGRTFKLVVKTVDVSGDDTHAWNVKGSKGDSYQVSLRDGNYSCTCSSYKFRGHCKHIESVQPK